jgi:hypothetical protein
MSWTAWGGGFRAIPAAQGYAEVDTEVLPGTPTLLVPPVIETNAYDDEVFYRDEAGIKFRRSGVYTGSIQVGDRLGTTTLTNLTIYRPNGAATEGYAQLNVPHGPTVHIPFTVWASDGFQAVTVVVQHSASGPGERMCWWRFSATRIGDAL